MRVTEEPLWVFWNAGKNSSTTFECTIDGDRGVILISQGPLPDDKFELRIDEKDSFGGP
ncbi:MAG: hypothetical protein KDA84_16125 [Planctomycetaceae bacterium]|nr:hypothetical protein [Planctomycetaceae bacterium]